MGNVEPENKHSATHHRFRVTEPEQCKIVEMNWRDNPWFPDVLEQERQEDLKKRPDVYDHIWEGDFRIFSEGAYTRRKWQTPYTRTVSIVCHTSVQ